MTNPSIGEQPRPIDILLVDDDEADVLLTRKALQNGRIYSSLSVARDGVEAMAFLRREGEYADAPRPHLILLDLNMPRKDGRETLSEIKAEESLKSIPVVVLTTSSSDADIVRSYDLQASSYVTKPVDFDKFVRVVKTVKNSWLCVVQYPKSH